MFFLFFFECSSVDTESQRIRLQRGRRYSRKSAPTWTPIFQVQLSVLDFLGFGYILVGFGLGLWIYGFSFRFLGVGYIGFGLQFPLRIFGLVLSPSDFIGWVGFFQTFIRLDEDDGWMMDGIRSIGNNYFESDKTVLEIINVLKDIVIIALMSGFSKTSYLVQDHVRYINRIKTAKSPISYVKFVARKLFLEDKDARDQAYAAKIAKVHESYKNKQALLPKFEALFVLYYDLIKEYASEDIPKNAVTWNDAEKTLAELLA
ncbi:hypothetical protein GLOIN_2v1789389 [Rhizophagus irregularis DAOM 181602=DAOM 197198]|nr:hypothetical protein GLOIN_2v1789389 [Rhizophagus irregularis DAOM 181602=DAOM 197198]